MVRTKGYIPIDEMTYNILDKFRRESDFDSSLGKFALALVVHCMTDYFDKKENNNNGRN